MEIDELGERLTVVRTEVSTLKAQLEAMRHNVNALEQLHVVDSKALAVMSTQLTKISGQLETISHDIRGNGAIGLATIRQRLNTLWFTFKISGTILGILATAGASMGVAALMR